MVYAAYIICICGIYEMRMIGWLSLDTTILGK